MTWHRLWLGSLPFQLCFCIVFLNVVYSNSRVQQRPTRSTAYRPMPANLTRKAATVREGEYHSMIVVSKKINIFFCRLKGKTQLYDDEVTPAHNTLKSPRGNNALSTSTSSNIDFIVVLL